MIANDESVRGEELGRERCGIKSAFQLKWPGCGIQTPRILEANDAPMIARSTIIPERVEVVIRSNDIEVEVKENQLKMRILGIGGEEG